MVTLNLLLWFDAQKISRACFQLLYYSIRENPEIQRFTAKMLPALFHTVSTNLWQRAALLRCSKETASCRKSHSSRTSVCKASKRFADEPIIFELLKATCVCSGKGVDKNPPPVANELIIHENNRQLLVKVTLNEKRRQSQVKNT